MNEDGTLRRIANWDSLTPLEQAVAFRRIAERNKQRLESLKQQQEIEEQGMEIDPEDIISSSDQPSNNTGQDIYALNASDFVLIALIAVVLITVLPSKIRRMLRRLSAAKNQSIKSD